MRKIFGMAAAMSLMVAAPAYACSIIEAPPEKRELYQRQADVRLVENARAADAIVRVRIVSAKGYEGKVQILEILDAAKTASVRQGAHFLIHSRSGSLCGIGTMPTSGEGVLFYSRKNQPEFSGFLRPREIDLLRENGLIR